MGILSAIFGTTPHISQEKRSLTVRDVRAIVSHRNTNTLSAQQEREIEQHIIGGLDGMSKISLYKIDQILKKLQYQKKISLIDRQGVMKQFEKHFNK